jgi:hypothetical protein
MKFNNKLAASKKAIKLATQNLYEKEDTRNRQL